MPYTSHGYWYGEPANGDHDQPPPIVDCGGPGLCVQCALEAHRGDELPPVLGDPGPHWCDRCQLSVDANHGHQPALDRRGKHRLRHWWTRIWRRRPR